MTCWVGVSQDTKCPRITGDSPLPLSEQKRHCVVHCHFCPCNTVDCETSDSQRWLQTMLAWERQQWGGDIGDIWHTAYLFTTISFSMGTVHRSALRSTLSEALLFLDLAEAGHTSSSMSLRSEEQHAERGEESKLSLAGGVGKGVGLRSRSRRMDLRGGGHAPRRMRGGR